MRILWVEDNDHITSEIQQNWFGEFNQTENVVRKSDFKESYQTVKEESRRYDLVILDINLEYSDSMNLANFEEEIVPPNEGHFLEEAGFHLYLRLILNCFPQNRIIFLTSNVDSENQIEQFLTEFRQAYRIGNREKMNDILEQIRELIHFEDRPKFDETLKNSSNFEKLLDDLKKLALSKIETIPGETSKNTFNEFKKSFYNARLLPPKAIDKKQDCSTHLQNWLNSHCHRTAENQAIFDYLTLRRAILDIIDEIAQNENVTLQSPFAEELDKDSFLEGLKWQLHDFNLPQNPHKTIYFALCDYLTKPFEQKHDFDKFSPLKWLRNWLAHGLIKGSKTILTAQMIGIVFLLVFKKMFNVEKYGFQDEIKRIFPDSPTDLSVIKNRIPSKGNIKDRGEKSINSDQWQNEDFAFLFYAGLYRSGFNQSSSNYLSKIICQEIAIKNK